MCIRPRWELEISDNDFVQEFMHRIIIKRSFAREHEVQYDSTRPDISHLSIIASVFNDLRCYVIQRATRRMHKIWTLLEFPTEHREAKVTYLNFAPFINKNVLRFQVPVRDTPQVAVVDSPQYLHEVLSSSTLINPVFLLTK